MHLKAVMISSSKQSLRPEISSPPRNSWISLATNIAWTTWQNLCQPSNFRIPQCIGAPPNQTVCDALLVRSRYESNHLVLAHTIGTVLSHRLFQRLLSLIVITLRIFVFIDSDFISVRSMAPSPALKPFASLHFPNWMSKNLQSATLSLIKTQALVTTVRIIRDFPQQISVLQYVISKTGIWNDCKPRNARKTIFLKIKIFVLIFQLSVITRGSRQR